MLKKTCTCIFLLLLLLMAACEKTGVRIEQLNSQAQGDQIKDTIREKPIQIALVMKTSSNPFFVEMEKGARDAEKELGIELIVKAGAKETSIEQQISIVEKLIDDKVDAIVIAPVNSKLIPVLKKAQDAGIVIVNIDNRLDLILSRQWGLEPILFISVDNEKGAYTAAKFISQQISEPAEAVIIEGILGATNSEDRKKGAFRAFRENENITVSAIKTANWKIDEGYEVIKKIYEQNPKIRAVFCANDMMALGVVRYLKETEMNNVLVAGYDALYEAREAIKSGWLTVTVDQHADIQGYLGVKYATKLLEGKWEPISGEILIETELVYNNSK